MFKLYPHRRVAPRARCVFGALAWVAAWTGWAQAQTSSTESPAAPVAVASPADCQRVGAIHLRRLDVFDTSLPEEDRVVFRLANQLHLETRESTLKQLLLFKTGDPYDPRLLQETERLMRSTGYLRDATIRPLGCADGAAEIEVLVQDVWTLKPGVSFGRKGGKNTSAISIEDSNLFGLGTQIGLDVKSGVDRNSRVINYHDPLLGGQRLDLTGAYAYNSDGKSTALGLERPFYALDTRWAAGISGRRESRVDSSYDMGQIVGQYQTRERVGNAYVGFSEGLKDGWVTRWTAGWTHDEHLAQPVSIGGTSQSVDLPADRRLVYPWVGVEWVQDQFRETRNQDQIGKTEDLALGWHVQGQLGFARAAFGADRRAAVFSFKTSKGLQPWPGHTFLFDASAQGRWEDDGLAGTLLSGSARYYLRQSDRRSFFVALASDRAIHPDSDQQVLLGGDSGLRGYPLRYQSGRGRWLFTAEQRWFTEWYPLRLFNVGGAVFYDMGRAWDQDSRTRVLQQGLLRDWGFGLRLGNARSALGNVVHIDVAFPLDRDPSIRRVQFLVEVKRSF